MGQKPKKELVCYCNLVERKTIEDAICNGANTLDKIFDRTTAGIGACGGSCRIKLHQLLDSYLKTQTFPKQLTNKIKK